METLIALLIVYAAGGLVTAFLLGITGEDNWETAGLISLFWPCVLAFFVLGFILGAPWRLGQRVRERRASKTNFIS